MSNGGNLASIHDVTTLSSIGSLVGAADIREGVWIGLHDMHLESGCEDTGFIWTDGTPTDYENWADGEPNDWVPAGGANCDGGGDSEGGEDCVEMFPYGVDLALRLVNCGAGARTTGGTAPEGTACLFPFEYRGVQYNECTTVGTGRNEPEWCSVEAVYEEGSWGNCVCAEQLEAVEWHWNDLSCDQERAYVCARGC